jgi:hypothetical protein
MVEVRHRDGYLEFWLDDVLLTDYALDDINANIDEWLRHMRAKNWFDKKVEVQAISRFVAVAPFCYPQSKN